MLTSTTTPGKCKHNIFGALLSHCTLATLALGAQLVSTYLSLSLCFITFACVPHCIG